MLRRCMSTRDMKEMLGRLRALGAPMQTKSVNETDGHAHAVYTNDDTYKGAWKDGKMNGYGTFTKNQVTKYKFDWQFCGQFKDDCALSGQLSTPDDPDGEPKPNGSYGYPIYEWNPFPKPGPRVVRQQDGEVGREQATGGPIKADQQLEEMERRAEERRRNKGLPEDDDADQKENYRKAAEERMMHDGGFSDRYTGH